VADGNDPSKRPPKNVTAARENFTALEKNFTASRENVTAVKFGFRFSPFLSTLPPLRKMCCKTNKKVGKMKISRFFVVILQPT
jgi:hypothetical protein